jgi:RNA polymerase sigma-70 factor (ECF subfamily)
MQAFRLLVERWERPVHAFLERMTGSREDAMDLTQETFIRAYRSAPRYHPSGRFRSWLFRIAGNLARSRQRRRKILRWIPFDLASHDLSSPGEPPDRALEREETAHAVRAALLALPDRQRQAVVLWKFEGLSYQEIADAMGTNANAVAQLLHRATNRLRRTLKLEEGTE